MSLIIRRAAHADIPGLARVHRETWQATYRGIIPDEYLDSLTLEKSIGFWERIFSNTERPGAEFVALDAEELIGFISGGPARNLPGLEGEIYALYLLPDFHGRGIGRSLMEQMVTWLRSNGLHTYGVWVLTDNPTRTFYSHLGGQLCETKTITIGGSELLEELYVWR